MTTESSRSSSSADVGALPPQQYQVTSFTTALIAGGMAGTCVDVALFPIDTLKTRLQSPVGFWKAGGLTGVYRGLGAAALGSAPGAALFFATYESLKPVCLRESSRLLGASEDSTSAAAYSHMMAASVGEAMACLVRVPTEVVKAKMQTSTSESGSTLRRTVQSVLQERQQHGGGLLQSLTGGLYRGYGITLFREIPFAMIQFPLYERLKVYCAESSWNEASECTPLQAAGCGSASGAVAAAVTTPLDVLKTRLMLGVDRHGVAYQGVSDVLRRLLQEEGPAKLLSGIQPRVLWITLGGFVFFGAYEEAKKVVQPVFG
jgi:solute carrier family 25 (mitochondrial S-adenosylmethionine transporter), member 26